MKQSIKPIIRLFPDLTRLSRAAAAFLCRRAQTCVKEKGRFALVLAGGLTPRELYRILANPPYDAAVPWNDVHLFWGDERCVTPEHVDSSYGMFIESFWGKLPVPVGNLHRIPANLAEPEETARIYEEELREFFEIPDGGGPAFPWFDMILLGMGDDGHTASLFRGDPALEEKERWAVAVPEPHGTPLVPRITLTLPVLNASACILFLAAGKEKGDIARGIAEDPDGSAKIYPAALVRPQGDLLWFVSG